MGEEDGIKNSVSSVDFACLCALTQYIIVIMHAEWVLY